MKIPIVRIRPNENAPIPVADLNRLEQRLLWAYEATLEDAQHWLPSPFEEQAAWLIVGGRAELKYDSNKSLLVRCGQWIFPPVGRPAIQRFSRGSRIVSLRFNCTWPDGARLLSFDAPVVLDTHNFPALESTARELVRTTATNFPDLRSQQVSPALALGPFLKQQAVFHSWLEAWTDALGALGHRPTTPDRGDPRVVAARRWLDARSLQTTFSRDEVARHVVLSASQLDRLFVQQDGQTACAYHERRRVRSAKHLLRSTSESIKVIAFGLGFRRPSHFSAWFQRAAGTSAREFRRAKSESV